MARIRHPKDFIAGLIFIAFGVTAIVVGSNYTLGTAARMGPGYFPRVLGTLLILLGGALSVRSLWLRGSPLPSWPLLNLPLIGMWIKLLQIPYRVLYPAILLFCSIGVYTVSNEPFDVMRTALFGALGIIFLKLECDPAPLLLGFVLGPMMEENLRRALLLSRGDPTVFVTRPISLGLLLAAVALLILIALPNLRKKREEAFAEAQA